ncbi:MAG: CvpA family protein [Candidatus Eremiobacteraeota bacterium]|nr:CvpA family protein [Candidatus Eremiobacteraeota bacterium]
MTWADILVGLTLLVAFWGGYRSGVIREMIAILSIIVAWALAGAFASPLAGALQDRFALSPGSGHLAAFWLLFLVIFAGTRALGWLVERFTSLPLLRIASGIGGGVVACAKAILLMWLVLFIALFFPIARDVRATLRRSPSVTTIEALNRPAFAMLNQSLPRNARPFANLILAHHRL